MSRPTPHPPHEVIVMKSALHALLLICIPCVLFGCGNQENSTPSPVPTTGMDEDMTDTVETGLTYHSDVRPIFDQRCGSCHIAQTRGDFSMEYKAASWRQIAPAWTDQAIEKINEDTPHWWNHDAECGQPSTDYLVTQEEKDTLQQWVTDGKKEGNAEDYTEPDTSLFTPPSQASTTSLSIPEYTLDQEEGTDIRCFLLEPSFASEQYLSALRINPHAHDVIDHISVAYIPPQEGGELLRVERDDRAPGFDCYGQLGTSKQSKVIYSWTPGMPTGLTYPEDHAYVLQEESYLVMMIHYNMDRINSDGEAPGPDQSSIDLWLMPEGQTPTQEIQVLPYAQVKFNIEPNQDNVIVETEHVAPVDMKILGFTPHMLHFGSGFELETTTLDANSSPNTSCIGKFNTWHYGQSKYTLMLEPEARPSLKQGDLFTQRCIYDNSQENQPVINRIQQTPQVVSWGTTVKDEMCINHIIASTPFNADTRFKECSVTSDCIVQCPRNDIYCFAECAIKSNTECTECAFTKMINCGGAACEETGLEVAQCLQVCDLNSGYGLNCIEQNCAIEWQNFSNCGIETFVNGTCKLNNCR